MPFKGDVSEAGTRFRLMKDARYLYGSVFCEEPEPEQEENITYENVAIPEIHIYRKKK